MPTVSDRKRMASQEAAYWYIRCSDERAMRRADRKLFLSWLKSSPENIAELLRIADMDGKFGRQRLIEKVKVLSGDSNVLEGHFGGGAAHYDYQPSKSVSDKVQRKANDKTPWKLVATVGAITVTAWLGFTMLNRPTSVMETVASEWQHKTIEDGSTIHMDARTRLKVELAPGQRIVHLYQGQAAFDVAKDSRRPFIVRTPLVDIIAVGTRFSVSLDPGVTTIVEEGVVKVIKQGEEEAVTLIHDEQLYVAPVAVLETPRVSELDKVHVNAKAKLEWTAGWVNFDGATVGEMVEQFNRRHVTQAEIKDPAVAGKHLRYARVRIDSVPLFKQAMDNQEGVAVTEDHEHKTLRLLPD
jgi:ferric-dicitrate binding protein FerR (iron transport regulator)